MPTSLEKEKSSTEHIDDPNDITTYAEPEETVWQALRTRPASAFWCIYVMWMTVLSNYDNIAGGQFISIPEFRKDFGRPFEGNYVLSAPWQSAFSAGPCVMAVIGAFTSSFLADRFGRKISLLVAYLMFIVGIALETTATTNGMFFAGKFINGYSVGGFPSVGLAYLAEIVPLVLRGIFTAANGFANIFGPFLVSLIVYFYGGLPNRWAYRSLFVSQYIVTGVGLILLPFMPESPWWLVLNNKEKEAANSLRRLGHSNIGIEQQIAAMKIIVSRVNEEAKGGTILDCFRGSNLRRTFLSTIPFALWGATGITFAIGYLVYYAQLAGYTAKVSFRINVAGTTICLVGNLVSLCVIDRVGRRNLTIYGLLAFVIINFVCGGLGTQPKNLSFVKGIIALLIIFEFIFNLTIGATAISYLAEVPTSKLRAPTVAIGIAVFNIVLTIIGIVLPYLFNPDKANLGAKTMFVFGGITFIGLIYAIIFQPETAKRTYEELDEMFEKKVPATQFKTYSTNVEQ